MQTKKPKKEEPDAVKIGLHIQQARNERGMTQEQLARQVRRNTNYIGNLENGRSCPPVKLLILLAKALDVTLTPSNRSLRRRKTRLLLLRLWMQMLLHRS